MSIRWSIIDTADGNVAIAAAGAVCADSKALIQDRDYQRKHERSLSASIVHSAVELKEPDLVFSNRAGTATVLLEIWRRQFSAV